MVVKGTLVRLLEWQSVFKENRENEKSLYIYIYVYIYIYMYIIHIYIYTHFNLYG